MSDVRHEIEHQIAMAESRKTNAQRNLAAARHELECHELSIAVHEKTILRWRYLLEAFDAQYLGEEEVPVDDGPPF